MPGETGLATKDTKTTKGDSSLTQESVLPNLNALCGEGRSFRRISDHCYDILAFLRNHNWQATAMELQQINRLNYRARISDLRRGFLIEIVADPKHPPPGVCAVYSVPPHARPRAAWLLDHLSLDGYETAPRQEALYK